MEEKKQLEEATQQVICGEISLYSSTHTMKELLIYLRTMLEDSEIKKYLEGYEAKKKLRGVGYTG